MCYTCTCFEVDLGSLVHGSRANNILKPQHTTSSDHLDHVGNADRTIPYQFTISKIRQVPVIGSCNPEELESLPPQK